jgi:hypothetical protein
LSILRNIRNTAADLSPPPNHARGASCWLTSAPINRTYTDIKCGISVDQVIANEIGGATSVSSLALANGGPVSAPNEGYSPIYYQNVSWRSETTAASRIEKPALLFDALFGSSEPNLNAARRRARRSVLDFSLAESRRLKDGLGGTDRQRMDLYFTSLREVEKKLDAPSGGTTVSCAVPLRPAAASLTFAEQIAVMSRLLVLALACDKTRVGTYMLDTARSNRNAEFAGVTGSFHDFSHHGGKPENTSRMFKVNAWYAAAFASFLDQMTAFRDPGGQTLLDNSIVVWGSGLGDSDGHRKDHIPLVVAGRGGGLLRPGRVIDSAANTPIANVHLTVMQHMGVKRTRFADSTGTIPL